MTNQAKLHRSLYLSDLPTSIYTTTLAFLTPQEQGRSSLISKVWHEASKSLLGQFALMQSLGGLSLRELRELIWEFPNLIERLARQKFNQKLDPTNKFIGRFLSKIIEYKARGKFEEAISFSRSLPERKREAISSLCFKNLIINDYYITEFFELFPNLKYLDLKKTVITGECLAEIPPATQLKSINLNNCHFLNEDCLKVFITKALQLKTLSLEGTNITGECLTEISPRHQLENISLNNCEHLLEEELEDFLAKSTQLKILNLEGTSITGECFTLIPTTSLLESISLNECKHLLENYLKAFIKKAAQLKTLNLESTNITGECLTEVSCSHQLESIHLNCCADLRENCFRVFIAKAIQLKILTFARTNITGECLTEISCNHQLECIHLNNCEHLLEDCLRVFIAKAIQLKILNLEATNITGECFAQFPLINQLESLNLSFCHSLIGSSLKAVIQSATQLKSLSLARTSELERTEGEFLTDLPIVNKLESINLSGCGLDNTLLDLFFERATQLKRINLSFAYTNGNWLARIRNDNKIEELILFHCEITNKEHLKNFLILKSAKLRKLDLSHLNISGLELSLMPENNKLEELSLSHCNHLNEQHLTNFFINKATNLKKINFFGSGTTGAGLSRFPAKNKLEFINVDSCPNIKSAYSCIFEELVF